jgi:single-strand DNA-binding protein
MNRVIFMGRLTTDPELKMTPNAVPVCAFNLAIDRNYQKDGEKQTDFPSCVAWRQTAEFICKYFKKGQKIALEGSYQTRTYEKDGQKRYISEVCVERVEFVESKNQGGAAANNAPLYGDAGGLAPA